MGLSEAVGKAMSKAARDEMGPLLAVIGLAIVLPLLELGIIAAMYTAISPQTDTRLGDLAYDILDWIGFESSKTVVIYLLLSFSVLNLILLVAAKFLQKNLNLGVMVRTYLHYARELVSAFFRSPPTLHTRLNRNAFSNALYAEAWSVGGLVSGLVGVTSNVLAAAILLAGCLVVSPTMTMGATIVAILVGLAFRSRYRRHRIISKERVEIQTALLAGVVDVLDGYRPIRLAGAEQTFSNRLRESFRRSSEWKAKLVKNQIFLGTISQALVYVVMLVVVTIALIFFSGDVGGTTLVILVLAQRIMATASLMHTEWLTVQGSAAATDRVIDLLEQCPQRKAPHRVSTTVGRVEPIRSVVFDNISFAHGDGEELYRNLNVRFVDGDRVLLQGPSGIGKSTLGLLACGLLEPSSGRVLINGNEFTEEQFFQLRSQISYIGPDLHVFNLPIWDNVFLAEGGDEKLLRKLAEQTRMEAVLERLNGDSDSTVGVEGHSLSLGERQRLQLMQAFLKRPSFLILDEATSNLNLELEDGILDSLLNALSQEAIVLIITHKPPRRVIFTHHYTLRNGDLVPLRLSHSGMVTETVGATT